MLYIKLISPHDNPKCKFQLGVQLPALHQLNLLLENRAQPASTLTAGAFAASRWILNLD